MTARTANDLYLEAEIRSLKDIQASIGMNINLLKCKIDDLYTTNRVLQEYIDNIHDKLLLLEEN